MLHAEQDTANFDKMTLTIAISYGGMWDMAHAAKQIALAVQSQALEEIEADQINVDLFENMSV